MLGKALYNFSNNLEILHYQTNSYYILGTKFDKNVKTPE